MKHIFQLLLVASSLWMGTPARSAAIDIRSGEHANFTRLVIYSPQTRSPELSPTDTGYRFSTGDPTDRFDLSKVFDKIPKTRIKEISMPASGLIDIVVDCACHSRIERLADGRFVIDIVTGNDQKTPSAPKSVPPRSQPAYHAQSIQSARRGLPIFASSQQIDHTTKALDAPEDSPISANEEPAEKQFDQNELLNQLARAAAQGLFTFDAPPKTPAETPPPSALAPSPPPAPTPKRQITVHTSVDRDTGNRHLNSVVSDNGDVCLSEQAFSVGSWGTNDQRPLQFPNYPAPIEGSRMTAGFSTPESLKTYLQQQLHLTLGAEVLAIIKDPSVNFDGKHNLILIAEIMENGEATDHQRMVGSLSCDNATALWAALSQPRLPRDADINTNAILSEFSALPKHIRTHLGPMLMRKFLSVGDTASATKANEIVARGGAPADTSNTLAEAKLSLAKTDFNAAEQKLSEVVAAEDQNSVEATLTLIESRITRNEGISSQELERLDALTTQHSATVDGQRLENAAIRALAHMAQFTEARERLHLVNEFPKAENTDHQIIINEFGRSLAQKASDGVFLRYVFGLDFWTFATEDTRLALANRLLELGFAQQAKTMLASKSFSPGRASRMLLAKAALEQNNPEQALSYISGLESNEAQSIRADALAQRNTTMANSNDQAPPVTDAATARDRPLNLEDLRELLTQAQQSRTDLEQGLQDTPAP